MSVSAGEARAAMVATGRSLFERRLTHGRTGNLSVRVGDDLLITPTNTGLGELDASRLSRLDLDGNLLDGAQPSKEAFLHLAMYRARPGAAAVVHLHSTHAVAVSCLTGLDPADALPPLTAYFAMRVGRLPMLPYHAPGDPALGAVAEEAAREHHALLLANHGPIVAGPDLGAATDAIEELEETARLYLLLRGESTRPLTEEQVRSLRPPGSR